MEKNKLLSLVVPAYKQEKTIIKDITNLSDILSSLKLKYEILVVVDGNIDNTLQKVQLIKNKHVKIFGYEENKGKGFAIKLGVEKAKGNIIGFLDAGMELDPRDISRMLEIMDWNNADIVVGSKLHPESKVNYPAARRILSWGYRMGTKMLFGFNVRDTQVGFKIFTRKTAKDVFSRIVVKRFAFDIEVLAVAYKLGYIRVYESPVKLDFKGASSISSLNFWRVILRMLWDTAAVFYRMRILKYYSKK